MKKPRILDLFCGAGGASVGYRRAGFEVVGADIKFQSRYPFKFWHIDVLKLTPEMLNDFDFIHASPPCQAYSNLAKRNKNDSQHPKLIEPVRALLSASGRPYIIENVVGAPLLNPVLLCGTMFLGLRVLRHRLFETTFPVAPLKHPKHPLCYTRDKRKRHYGRLNEMQDFVQVTGGGNCSVAAARDAMGIDWMAKSELNEAIPPAYTAYIGSQARKFFESF